MEPGNPPKDAAFSGSAEPVTPNTPPPVSAGLPPEPLALPVPRLLSFGCAVPQLAPVLPTKVRMCL